jgi:hypothetical protein
MCKGLDMAKRTSRTKSNRASGGPAATQTVLAVKVQRVTAAGVFQHRELSRRAQPFCRQSRDLSLCCVERYGRGVSPSIEIRMLVVSERMSNVERGSDAGRTLRWRGISAYIRLNPSIDEPG